MEDMVVGRVDIDRALGLEVLRSWRYRQIEFERNANELTSLRSSSEDRVVWPVHSSSCFSLQALYSWGCKRIHDGNRADELTSLQSDLEGSKL
jgi:hypothetical protein